MTHPEATRYFMTIPEAVQLVLLAGAMGDGGETFLLRMGEPVRIVDLARNLIELSGLKADEDIKIVFTGLRPGEKLHEELQSATEDALPTSNNKIMVLTGLEPLGDSEWQTMKRMEDVVIGGDPAETLSVLRLLVPEYTPTSEIPTRHDPASARIVDIGAKRRLDAQA